MLRVDSAPSGASDIEFKGVQSADAGSSTSRSSRFKNLPFAFRGSGSAKNQTYLGTLNAARRVDRCSRRPDASNIPIGTTIGITSDTFTPLTKRVEIIEGAEDFVADDDESKQA